MFKVIATEVVISKGFEGAPALRFSENGDSVRFRIGKRCMTQGQRIIIGGSTCR